VQVFAHRGSSWDHPENTLEAFEAALGEGATGIETDLHLSRDGGIVLAHDADLLRMGGDPRRIAELTTRELGQLRIAETHRVPLLQDLWDLAAGRVRLNLEIKAPGVARVLARFLVGRDADVLVTSALPAELDALRDALPTVPTGPVLARWRERERKLVAARRHRAVSLSVRAFSAAHVRACHALGAELLVWVVNDPARVLDLAAVGVDGVFTDRPLPILSTLRTP
jgi:glycerophosphoryl diester phosphodiesterase